MVKTGENYRFFNREEIRQWIQNTDQVEPKMRRSIKKILTDYLLLCQDNDRLVAENHRLQREVVKLRPPALREEMEMSIRKDYRSRGTYKGD